MKKQTTVGKLAWHIHHDILCEQLIESIKNRIAYIKKEKFPEEIPTRLKLLKLVKGPVPKRIEKALADYNLAHHNYVAKDMWTAYRHAQIVLQAALKSPAMEKLHARECKNCPWNGETIFPEDKVKP